MDIQRQQSGVSSTDRFLDPIADPFQAEVQQNSIYAAIVYSFVTAGLLFLVFCFLRPRNSRVYAPQAKHVDEKHRPKPLGKKPFSWLDTVKGVNEQDCVDKVGLDAVIFLRFMRMVRNIFCVVTAIGCGISIPVNIVGGSAFYQQ
ncbi:late exocytosis, associated with Golgi transport-domain-containing protein [Phaeosphaeriaceae sp. PMI808]|nr:late exocytosis, associated with Golgi transport-domain-containing protein [Phaeosphaeriaceae sp. PMI808]